jgi:hypothetical protein
MEQNTPPQETDAKPTFGVGSWITVIVLGGILLVAIFYAVHAWSSMNNGISTAGWVFMIMGIVFTTAVGAGLMGLVFYSSRHNFDQ